MSRSIRSTCAALTIFALAFSARNAFAHQKQHEFCRKVKGTFTNQFLSGRECSQSPLLLCTRGQLSGDLQGAYSFNFTSMVPVNPNEENPTVFDFTGKSTVMLQDGELFSRDTGTIEENPTAPAPFINHIHFVRGTGDFVGVHGNLLVLGEANLMTGEGHGTYSGEICTPQRDPDHDCDND